jgi:hypothetical protein
VLPVPHTRSRILLVVDCVTNGVAFAQELIAEGHEVHWARDTAEARWLWMRNYFDSVIVCAEGARGFVERIRKECPHQKIEIVSPDDLKQSKKPAARVSDVRSTERKTPANNVLQMPSRGK